MPFGRSVLLLRRLSKSENRLKNININSCGKESPLNVNSFCSYHRDFYSKRFSTFSQDNILIPQLRRSYSDNIIKMSETHKHTNRLIKEKSPYLLQHAHNPVDWFPWGQEAFDKARSENKLIFLSVGYSTCHWCHVMERESFENVEIAKVLNDHYVSIKVDREERPDIDNIYMMFISATTGRGGWPMSVFLTPELRPVTGGTYFSPSDSFGRPGFKSILLNLNTKWNEKNKEFLDVGKGVVEALEKMLLLNAKSCSKVPGETTWKKCVMHFMNMFEPEYGGFGTAPKFPQASVLNFLFHCYARDKLNLEAKQCLEICLYTLTKIAKGGIHDHVSSGISRYSVDNDWHVPHFEKMLYDQGQLAVVYTNAYLATKDEFYAEVVRDIIKYANRDLRHKSGGYYSAEDADSYPTAGADEKKEGAFYVWEFHELKSLLENKTINSLPYLDIICDYFNVEEDGNISPESDPHEELTNKNVLIIYGSKADTAKKFGITINDLNKVLKESIEIMHKAREKRPRPHLDTKMMCSWNGLMISGLAQAGQGLGNKTYVDDAIKAAKFIKTHLYDEKNNSLFHSCYKSDDGKIVQGEKPIKGFLEDYAFLIRGLLDLYEASLDLQWLHWARVLQVKQNELFWDEKDGAYFYSSNEDKSIIIRMKPEQDNAEPSGNSVSCHNLIRLAAYADKSEIVDGGDKDRERAKKILTLFADRLNSKPSTLTAMMSALMFYNDSPTQVLIAGKCNDPRTMELVKVVRSRLLPGRVLAVADPAAITTDSAPAGMFDLLLTRIRPVGDQPTAYVCRRYACSLPVTDAKQLEKLLDQNPTPNTVAAK